MINRFQTALFIVALATGVSVAGAQSNPTPAQAQAAMTDPAIRARLMAQIRASGMTQDQIRLRLRSMGYSDAVINQLLGGAGSDTTRLTEDVFAAVRDLGIMDSTSVDSLRAPFVARQRLRAAADSALLDSLSYAIQNDSIRAAIARVLRSPAARRVDADSGFQLFGREIFSQRTSRFDPSIAGPLPPNYRIGVGDQFTLVLTGDIEERTEQVTVLRDGTVVLRDAGQIPVAGLTFEQLNATLRRQLGRVYSPINTGSARVSVQPRTIGTNQVFVHGEVVAPNAYPISRLGTVLTALYAAGGPSDNGDARNIEIRRGNAVIATMDLYDYLLTGSSSSDVRLENGDVVFVRVRGPRARVAGAVVRPATYELKPGESLADAIRMAGGFRPEADRRRVQIERIVPPTERGASGSDKEVLDITSPSLATGFGPTNQRLESGDVIRVFTVANHVANRITVEGNVWSPNAIAFEPGIRISQTIARAGGLKPDSYLGAVHVSRLQPDSTRRLLRVGFRADGTPADDIEMAPSDVVQVFSVSTFRTPDRTVRVGGAVRNPREIPYQEGMTLRDAIMLAGGLLESALLTEAEIARLPENRANGVTAVTMRVPLDSSYLMERSPTTPYAGPPGVGVASGRTPDVLLQPYDAISILHQPDFAYQSTVLVTGRVRYSGSYALKSKTERLYDILVRAGGLAADADSSAIVFFRSRDSTGRIGLDLPRVLRNPADIDNIVLVDGDSIHIPAYNAIVTVRGAVNSPAAAVPYVRGADIDYYIRAAGGGTVKADESKAYVLQPGGKFETKRRRGVFYTSDPKPMPGSTVQVPETDATAPRRDWVAVAQTTVSLVASLLTVLVLVDQIRR